MRCDLCGRDLRRPPSDDDHEWRQHRQGGAARYRASVNDGRCAICGKRPGRLAKLGFGFASCGSCRARHCSDCRTERERTQAWMATDWVCGRCGSANGYDAG